ncbi:D-alanyl-D-alanine carboxypeptidase family protein [Rhodococcus sp. HNM0569]|uniref:D-alanyl-D-alanine carboxypeptidase family protein n=1 Tax=Rhodococcus sp. HNM0569 TaxID=2716340 RepID=UPI00146B2C28|nr:D-alanyl-D-alanine carboxypeptidase family protein [Rhodococcus sp. HNM0569]NLU81829.1 D-alanyl-D-alanine carboxypeptidase [Rhodococcus sp. HNM0569]
MLTLRTLAVVATCGALVLAGGTAAAQPIGVPLPAEPAHEQPPPGPTTPNTDACPFRLTPAPAADESEVPRPGAAAPEPLPVPATTIGGSALSTCGYALPPGAPPLPEGILAAGWLLSDVDTGEVLAAKDPHGRYRPASTIKILLALVALDELDLNKTVVALQEDEDMEGSRVGVGLGGTYTLHTVMQGLMMASGNDTANMLARELGGVDATVAKMNAKAQALGALDTRAATPSGLDGPGQSSSPYDLSLLFREALKNPVFRELISVPEVFFPGHPKDPADPLDFDRPGFELTNDNDLLYNYPGALGGKTGFTNASRHTYVGGAQRDGRTLQVTLMGGEAIPDRPWVQAARLLDYGFALPAGTSVGTLDYAAGATSHSTVALAEPPAEGTGTTDTQAAPDTSEAAEASGDSGSDTTARVVVGVVGGLVVLALLAGAWALARRRRD